MIPAGDAVRRTAFGIKLRTGRAATGRFLDELMLAERMPRDALDQLQQQRTRDLVAFAMQQSPFYRRAYAGLDIDPERLADPGEWNRLPIIGRTTVKEHQREFATREAGRSTTRIALTGGSTGEPLQTMHDTRVRSLALSWRMYSWWGVAPYDDLARMGRWALDRRSMAKNAFAWWPSRQLYVDARLLTTESMTAFHRSLERVRPRLFEGYVGAMLEFAEFLERRRLSIPAPVAVATTAAPLTSGVRQQLEQAFGAPVYDEYRVSEFGWTAGECAERSGMHVFSDVRRVEVVDPEGVPLPAGSVGELVVTDLRNRVFPLIRYRIGDRGSLREQPCRCGRSLPLMDPPDGRTMDLVRLPNGDVLAHVLTGMFSADPDAVRRFQLHQHADFSITLRVVPGQVPDGLQRIERAADQLRARVAPDVRVRVELVAALPHAAGKLQYIISDVPTD